MKTNVIMVKKDGVGIDAALRETERFAAYQHLDRKETLRLRLLAEEMLGMIKGVVGEFDAKFWVEGEDKEAQLMLEANVLVDYEQREQLLSLSSSGKNHAHKTFMGKLAGIFEYLMMSYDETAAYVWQQADLSYNLMPGLGYEQMWSLDLFRSNLEENLDEEVRKEEWDELEKSIVAKLADEVIVGIKSRKVQMIIKKSFRE